MIDCETLPLGYEKINTFDLAATDNARARFSKDKHRQEQQVKERSDAHKEEIRKDAERLYAKVKVHSGVESVADAGSHTAGTCPQKKDASWHPLVIRLV